MSETGDVSDEEDLAQDGYVAEGGVEIDPPDSVGTWDRKFSSPEVTTEEKGRTCIRGSKHIQHYRGWQDGRGRSPTNLCAVQLVIISGN